MVAAASEMKNLAQDHNNMAMTDAANQAAWYQSFLSELGYTVDDPIPIHGDNKGAINLSLNPVMGH